MDNKFVYKTIYNHEVRNSFIRKTLLWTAWIVIALWTTVALVKIAFSLGPRSYYLIPELVALMLWKQILAAILLLLFVPLEKEVKEECDYELTIDKNNVTILYKNLNYRDKEYGELVDTLTIYQLKEMYLFFSFGGGLKFRGKSEFIICNKSGKKLYKYSDPGRHEVKFYVPTDILLEVYKSIAESIKNRNKNIKVNT